MIFAFLNGVSVPYSSFFSLFLLIPPYYRHYESEHGRWLSSDPIEEQGGVNLYEFVGNQPLLGIDYFGLRIEFNPTEPSDVTPEWRFFLGPHWRWKAVLAPSYDVSCSCECDQSDRIMMVCKVSTSYEIFINTRTTPDTGETFEGIYGHEQAHINSRNHRVQDAISGLSPYHGPFDLFDTCEEWIDGNEEEISDAIDKAWEADDHGHNVHSPSAGVTLPQVPNTPSLPTHPGSSHPSLGGAPPFTP